MSREARMWVRLQSRARGTEKFVLFAVADECAAGSWDAVMSMVDLMAYTGLHEKTIDRARKVLRDELGELAFEGGGGRGHKTVYSLTRAATLPFFPGQKPPQPAGVFSNGKPPRDAGVLDDGNPRVLSMKPPHPVHGNPRVLSGQTPASCPENPRDLSGAASRDLVLGSVRTEVLSTASAGEAAAAFLAWFVDEYPRHRQGVRYRVANAATETAAVRELLATRSVGRLQAMALAMWRDRADPWLNDVARPNDRGIFALRHKSTYLESVVVASGVQSSAPDVWTDVLARLEARTDRHAFFTWLKPLRLAEDRGAVLVLEPPDEAIGSWVRRHHSAELARAVEDVRPGATVRFRVAGGAEVAC